MAQVFSLAAQVLAPADPKKAGDFLQKFMDALFPEAARAKEATLEDRMEQLKEFSGKEVALVPGKGGFALSVKDKK